jgi:GntR family transcriptional regulator/MocR family aminotransferase
MKKREETQKQEPAYIQLYHGLVRDIVAGVYPYRSKLPSKRVLADKKDVSVITVDHALELLNEEGYVQSKERSGVYVIYKAEDFLKEGWEHESTGLKAETDYLEKANKGIDVADTSWKSEKNEEGITAPYRGGFPFSVLAKTMRRVILDYDEKILIKSPNHGCQELRNEICHYLARSRGIDIRPGQVIIGSGAEYLYGLIAQMLGPGSVVALEDPSYGKIRQVYEAMGHTCEMPPIRENGIATKDLEKTGAQILHVTPFNSYPSGVTVDISKKMEYLRWAKQKNRILVEDNYDSELTVSRKVEQPLFSMDDEAKVIYLNTFSRTLAPSMRIGYMILPRGMVKTFEEKLGFYSCPVPIFDQYVLAELLKSGDFERHINRVRRKRRGDLKNS